MIFGRLLGWVMVCIAILIASGEAVLALGTGSYEGLATREVWVLLAGNTPTFGPDVTQAGFKDILVRLLDWPAWVVIGGIGLTVILACRPRRRRVMTRTHHFV